VGNSKDAGQFVFEVDEGAQGGRGSGEMVEGAAEQIEQLGLRVPGLHGGFKQLAAVGRQQRGGIAFPQSFAPLADGNLAQRVELAAACAVAGDVTGEKQIELSCKGTARAACALCHGLDESVALCEPVDDQTGIAKAGEPDDGGRGGLHSREGCHSSTAGDATGAQARVRACGALT
jgi:hypothetical protein